MAGIAYHQDLHGKNELGPFSLQGQLLLHRLAIPLQIRQHQCTHILHQVWIE